MANKITISLTFRDYELRRVKPTGKRSLVYVRKDWVGKDVMIIPVQLNITDRWIEKHRDKRTGKCYINIKSDRIINKEVKPMKGTGRIYMPNELLGIDVLIIESPIIENLY